MNAIADQNYCQNAPREGATKQTPKTTKPVCSDRICYFDEIRKTQLSGLAQ
jgi:hypothetical protein